MSHESQLLISSNEQSLISNNRIAVVIGKIYGYLTVQSMVLCHVRESGFLVSTKSKYRHA